MPWVRWFLLIAFLLGLALLGCDPGDDEDKDDQAPPVPDDDATDDDVADDDSDGQPPDYGREPLAVLACGTTCASVGEEVEFSGHDSVDPFGQPLTYRLDYGDGQAENAPAGRHAYAAAGAYRVVLTVTNAEGYADRSSCVVAVGEFPDGPGGVDDLSYVPNYYDPTIIEFRPRPDHGGVVYGAFVAPADAEPDAVLINGEPADPAGGLVAWCEVVPSPVRAGEVAVVRCASTSAAFDVGREVEMEVRAGEAVLWSARTILAAPALSPTYISATPAGDAILLHVRNDAWWATTVTGISLDGTDVTGFAVIDDPVLAPGATTIVRLPQCAGVEYGTWRVFTVSGTDGEREVSSSVPIRLFPPVFAVGTWTDEEDDLFRDLDALRNALDAGINLHTYRPSPENPPESVLALAEEHDFYLWTTSTDRAFAEGHGDHPRLLAVMAEDEPEFRIPPAEGLARLQAARAVWGPRKPLWINHACSYDFAAWGRMPDISGMDHYCVFAGKCNWNAPLGWWDRMETLAIFAEQMKLNAEPRPVWFWSQTLSWMRFSDEIRGRCITDDEVRAQLYTVLSRGPKSLLWFIYTKATAAACPELLDGMARISREIAPLREVLLEGDVAAPGTVVQVSDAKVDATATVSPAGIAIVLNNLDYDLNYVLPWEWRENRNLVVQVTPPQWIEPRDFLLVEDDRLIPLAGEKVGERCWRFFLPSLHVAAAVLIVPEP